MLRTLALCALAAPMLFVGPARAALIVNAARPITDRINVNLIALADNDGNSASSTAGMFGTATQQAEVFSFVDTIYAQAGVDVNFSFRAGTYNSTFARTGTPGHNAPRPQSDLNAIRNAAVTAGGVLSSDSNTINVFLTSIVPGFSQLGTNSAAGLATIHGNGIAYYGGSGLRGFTGGREVLASVLAHEIGHNLGLSHNSIAQNLMQSGGGNDDGERLDAGQIAIILASRFTVTAPPLTLPGDFNGSGRVDGADFLLWQRGGSPGGLSTIDLTTWRANFGRIQSTGAATQVPEPSSILIAFAAALCASPSFWPRNRVLCTCV